MIFIALILAFSITFGVLCVMAVTQLYFKNEILNWVFLAVFFVVSFIYIGEITDHLEFCQSAVFKVCPKGGGEYVR